MQYACQYHLTHQQSVTKTKYILNIKSLKTVFCLYISCQPEQMNRHMLVLWRLIKTDTISNCCQNVTTMAEMETTWWCWKMASNAGRCPRWWTFILRMVQKLPTEFPASPAQCIQIFFYSYPLSYKFKYSGLQTVTTVTTASTPVLVLQSTQAEADNRWALIKAKYSPEVMPVQHFMNPGQLCVTGTQMPLTPPSKCVRCTIPHCLAHYPQTVIKSVLRWLEFCIGNTIWHFWAESWMQS